MSTPEQIIAELQARVVALEEAVRDGGFSFVRCGGRSHRFTSSALTALEKLSGADQLEVKAALAAVDCPFVTLHDVRQLAPTKVG